MAQHLSTVIGTHRSTTSRLVIKNEQGLYYLNTTLPRLTETLLRYHFSINGSESDWTGYSRIQAMLRAHGFLTDYSPWHVASVPHICEARTLSSCGALIDPVRHTWLPSFTARIAFLKPLTVLPTPPSSQFHAPGFCKLGLL